MRILAVLALTVMLCRPFAWASGGGDELFDRLPPCGADYALYFDVAELRDSGFFKLLAGRPGGVGDFLDALDSTYRITPDDCDAALVFGKRAPKLSGILVATALDAERLGAKLAPTGGRCRRENIQGRSVWVVNAADCGSSLLRGENVLCFVAPGVMLGADYPDFAAIMTAPAKPVRKLVLRQDYRQGPAWGVADMKALCRKNKSPLGRVFKDAETLHYQLRFTPGTARGWSASGVIRYDSAQRAMQSALMLSGYVQMLAAGIFGGEPELSEQVLKNFAVRPSGKELFLEFTSDDLLSAKLEDFFVNNPNSFLTSPEKTLENNDAIAPMPR